MALIDKRTFCLLLVCSLWLGLTVSYGGRSPYGSMSSEQNVTDAVVITRNLDQFNNKTVTLFGRFTTDTHRVDTDVECEPIPEDDITILERYRPYPTPWGIIDGETVVGIQVRDTQNTSVGTRPDFEEGQEIQLTGEVVSTLVTPKCSRKGYRSFYLLVSKADLPFKQK